MINKNSYIYRIYGMRLIADREISHLLTDEKAKELDAAEGILSCELPTIYIKKGVPEKIREYESGVWNIGERESYLANKTCWLYVCNGEEIFYELRPDGLDKNLNSYLLGFGMAFLALQKGYLPVHSSGLYKDGKAILISGDSGAGKSTLTASYIEEGYNLMADDITYVLPDEAGNPYAYPAFPYQKLCRNEVEKRHSDDDGLIYINEEKDKFLVPWRGEYSANPKPLTTIIFLMAADTSELKIEEITGIAKMSVLSKCLFMRKIIGGLVYQQEIGSKLMWLASKVRVIGVVRPNGKNTIEEIVKKTLEII